MAAPETLIRQRIKSVVATQFSAEGFTVKDDKLTRAAGHTGHAALAVYPLDTVEDPRNNIRLIVRVVLQMYLPFTAKPDESIVVDPGVIEGYGERLRAAFNTNSSGTGNDFWYVKLTRIEYPDDPTGNKSRLEATFEGYAYNEAIGA